MAIPTSLEIAETCRDVVNYSIDYIFKASFDKANRTKPGKRGTGLEMYGWI